MGKSSAEAIAILFSCFLRPVPLSANPGGVAAMILSALPCAMAHSKPSRRKFLLTSDIHFNPMADPDLVPELAKAAPTQWESILRHSQLTSFSRYGFDTNWWLLDSALDQMRTTLPHPAFIMITGDLLAHDFPKSFLDATHDDDRDHYRDFVLKTVEFLALEFRKRFGDTRIFLSIGNNDEECGNYSVRAGGIFLGDTAEVARSWRTVTIRLLPSGRR